MKAEHPTLLHQKNLVVRKQWKRLASDFSGALPYQEWKQLGSSNSLKFHLSFSEKMEIQDLEACDRAVRAQEQLYHVNVWANSKCLDPCIGGGPGEKKPKEKRSVSNISCVPFGCQLVLVSVFCHFLNANPTAKASTQALENEKSSYKVWTMLSLSFTVGNEDQCRWCKVLSKEVDFKSSSSCGNLEPLNQGGGKPFAPLFTPGSV